MAAFLSTTIMNIQKTVINRDIDRYVYNQFTFIKIWFIISRNTIIMRVKTEGITQHFNLQMPDEKIDHHSLSSRIYYVLSPIFKSIEKENLFDNIFNR